MEPIEYQIVSNLQQALSRIAVTDGYHYDVITTAVKLDPDQDVESLVVPDGPRPFVLIELKPDEWEYFPANQMRLSIPLTIHWFNDSMLNDTPDLLDEAKLRVFLRGCADVERAIAVDISRGGLATDTRILQRQFSTLEKYGVAVWAEIDTRITVNRTFGQPDA